MSQVVGLVRQYLKSRLQREPMEKLNQLVRDLRVVLQQVVTNYFLPLSLPQARQFRSALADQLLGVCNELNSSCTKDDEEHHRYCVREVIASFEWAEQIKEEVPDDPVTQKILAVDIPILRPFDYGLKKGKVIQKPSKHR
ncbi:MAG: hypothetical protein A2979_04080 [Deltaproteobacteria bacterium RIFCSPLOWO2_01_FULL_45_74]|nr:MAG: hypothetical protein A3D22_06360 [Deltaproteobacteria bacterium RIFCSPHIGHO2_02_FULL_44_53]OGQ33167.1 MAG: hypothetical protein A2979_04080 [Deltaproteobacteria bacterium RIFCSPLOWO2_01_FULL_45_74]